MNVVRQVSEILYDLVTRGWCAKPQLFRSMNTLEELLV